MRTLLALMFLAGVCEAGTGFVQHRSTYYGESENWKINYSVMRNDALGEFLVRINAIHNETNHQLQPILVGGMGRYHPNLYTAPIQLTEENFGEEVFISLEINPVVRATIGDEVMTDFTQLWYPSRFDANWDFLYNFGDISPYIQALTDPTGYLLDGRMQWSVDALCGGPCGFHTLTPFAEEIINVYSYSGTPGPPSATAIPEPSTIRLALLLPLLLRCSRRRT